MIVDDHDLFRTGLSSLLASKPEFEVVAQASSGRMGVRLARELAPDVILMDLRMPDLGGEEATRLIVEQDPRVRIVVLSVAADEAAVAGAVRAGACGYIVKDSPIDDVVEATRAAAHGVAWLSPGAAGALLERVRREHARPVPDESAIQALSPREIEVLTLVAHGQENGEIAAELGISARTAKNHVSSILAKLEVHNRVQAAVFAVMNDLY
jgi:NarL family two-component system response regulator LiaR